MDDLEKIAELGQVNAFQEWYRFNEVGDNKNIDERAEKIGHNYNGLFVKARIGSKEEKTSDEQRIFDLFNVYYTGKFEDEGEKA